MVLNTLKRWATKYLPLRINKGYGVSSDDNFAVSDLPQRLKKGEFPAKTTLTYAVKDDIGRFEFLGHVRNNQNSYYQVRSLKTGEVFNVSKRIFTLMFERTVL